MFGLSYLKIGAAIAIVAVIGLEYLHNNSILDREDLRAVLADSNADGESPGSMPGF